MTTTLAQPTAWDHVLFKLHDLSIKPPSPPRPLPPHMQPHPQTLGRNAHDLFISTSSRVIRIFNLPRNASTVLPRLFADSALVPPSTAWVLREEYGGKFCGEEDSVWVVFKAHEDAQAALALHGNRVLVNSALESDLEPFHKLRKFDLLDDLSKSTTTTTTTANTAPLDRSRAIIINPDLDGSKINTYQHRDISFPPTPPDSTSSSFLSAAEPPSADPMLPTVPSTLPRFMHPSLYSPQFHRKASLPTSLSYDHFNSTQLAELQSQSQPASGTSDPHYLYFSQNSRPLENYSSGPSIPAHVDSSRLDPHPHLRSRYSTPDLHSHIRQQNGEQQHPDAYTHVTRDAPAMMTISSNPPNPRAHEFRQGDWICVSPVCAAHNFMRNMNCISCGYPRPVSGSSHQGRKGTNPTTTAMMPHPPPTTSPLSPRFAAMNYPSQQSFFHPLSSSSSESSLVQQQQKRERERPTLSVSIPSHLHRSKSSQGSLNANFLPPSSTRYDQAPASAPPNQAPSHLHSAPSFHQQHQARMDQQQQQNVALLHHQHRQQEQQQALRSRESARDNVNASTGSSPSILTPDGKSIAQGWRVINVSRDELNPIVISWPVNADLPDPGQIRPHSEFTSHPPIMNTGNSGPIQAQAGDWYCLTCGYTNWRRRRVCQSCFPYADGNADGVSNAAQIEKANMLVSLGAFNRAQQQQQQQQFVGAIPQTRPLPSSPTSAASFRQQQRAGSPLSPISLYHQTYGTHGNGHMVQGPHSLSFSPPPSLNSPSSDDAPLSFPLSIGAHRWGADPLSSSISGSGPYGPITRGLPTYAPIRPVLPQHWSQDQLDSPTSSSTSLSLSLPLSIPERIVIPPSVSVIGSGRMSKKTSCEASSSSSSGEEGGRVSVSSSSGSGTGTGIGVSAGNIWAIGNTEGRSKIPQGHGHGDDDRARAAWPLFS